MLDLTKITEIINKLESNTATKEDYIAYKKYIETEQNKLNYEIQQRNSDFQAYLNENADSEQAKALLAIINDTSLSAVERQQKIDEIVAEFEATSKEDLKSVKQAIQDLQILQNL